MDDDAWMDEAEVTEQSGAEREWNALAERYTNDGYREGITAGKESHLQEGFDQGFAQTGVPVGRKLGNLRGTAAALLQFCTSVQSRSVPGSQTAKLSGEVEELKLIAQGLGELQLRDLAPRDAEAIAHAREHGTPEPSDEEGGDDDPGNQLAKALGGMKTLDGEVRLTALERRLREVMTRLGLD